MSIEQLDLLLCDTYQITDWVNEQKMDEKIEEKVSEALARRDKDEAEES